MIDQKILTQLPEMAQAMHFAMNKSRVQDSEWVTNFVKKYPTPELQNWDTTIPVLSACHLLKIWFRDHIPNHYRYNGGFTDRMLLSDTVLDHLKESIALKHRDLHKASQTIDVKHPFQTNICDTIIALLWAENLIQCMEDGLFVNWITLETHSEIEI